MDYRLPAVLAPVFRGIRGIAGKVRCARVHPILPALWIAAGTASPAVAGAARQRGLLRKAGNEPVLPVGAAGGAALLFLGRAIARCPPSAVAPASRRSIIVPAVLALLLPMESSTARTVIDLRCAGAPVLLWSR